MEFEKICVNKWKKISAQSKAAFIGTFIIGLLDYLYIITNHFLTLDSMWNQYSDQNMITSGRQFLKYACMISSYFDLPAVNGILAIFYLSLAAAFLVHIFNIKSKILAVVAGGILVSFPAISSTFCYTYTVDGYMLAVLLMVIAFYLMERYSYGWIGSAVLVCISLGIYQAYYSFLIILCVLKLLAYIIENVEIKKVLIKGLRYVLAGVPGYILYAVTLKVMLKYENLSLSGYQGSDRVMGFNLAEIPINCYKATRNFFSFIVSMNVLTGNTAMKIGFYGTVLVALISFVVIVICNKIYKSPIRLIMIIVLMALTPMLATLAMVMAPDVYFHVLMRLPWALFFIFALYLSQQACEKLNREGAIKKLNLTVSSLAVIFVSIMILQFAVMQGIVAFNMNERYEKSYGLCSRIVARFEQLPDYSVGDPVAIIGGGLNTEKYPTTSMTDSYVGWYFGVNGELCVSNTADIQTFCAHYLGFYFIQADEDAVNEILTTDEFAQMGDFPDADCISNINGVWVVKLVNP